MRKFAVFSGFLGAGKTSLMMALTKFLEARGEKAAMISNDLGETGPLADHRLAVYSGVPRASEITGECICFCHDVLTQRLKQYFDEGCTLVCSDIPGFGVGALEHVYHGLARNYPGLCALAPFTVVVEPQTARLLMRDASEDDDVAVIARAQLKEADLVLLNKLDLLPPDGRDAILAAFRARFPAPQILPVSAATGEGMEAVAEALRAGTASLRRPEIDYAAPALRTAMGKLSEYYLQYRAVVCCDSFDGTAYLRALGRRILDGMAALRMGYELPHGKLLAWTPEGDYCKLDLMGTGRGVLTARPFQGPCADIAVVFNASALCPAKTLDGLVDDAMRPAAEEYNLEVTVFRKEFFGMGG